MCEGFIRFPRTPHLVWPIDRPQKTTGCSARLNLWQMVIYFTQVPLGDQHRQGQTLPPGTRSGGDLSQVNSQPVAFLVGNVIVEEKVDGANIGLSLDSQGTICAQNRGSWIERGADPQFQPLWAWIAERHAVLTEILRADRILFGSGASPSIGCGTTGCRIGSSLSVCSIVLRNAFGPPKGVTGCWTRPDFVESPAYWPDTLLSPHCRRYYSPESRIWAAMPWRGCMCAPTRRSG
jgi:hypothetical protein